MQQEDTMADDIRRDERDQPLPSTREGTSPGERSPGLRGSPRESGSPLGTDPQEASPLPGDPREAQEPQEPRSTHLGAPGREETPFHEETARPRETVRPEDTAEPLETRGPDRIIMDEPEDPSVVDQLKDAWDRIRGKR
jgi:hypothetical protein